MKANQRLDPAPNHTWHEQDPYERIAMRAEGVSMLMVMACREMNGGDKIEGGPLSERSWDRIFMFVQQTMDDMKRDAEELWHER